MGRPLAGRAADVDATVKFQCRCVWRDEQCPNDATQEDGLCDWCGVRRPEDLRTNPNVVLNADGSVWGLGGRGEVHQNGPNDSRTPSACWMEHPRPRASAEPVEYLTIEHLDDD